MRAPLTQRLRPTHLRLIRAIHDSGKLQLAAEIVGMSQPAASRMLSEIETDVGAALFDRLPRGMVPTEIGAAFARHARVILAEVDALSEEVTQLRRGRAGVVRVGSVTGPTVAALVPALVALRREIPDMQPTIEVAPSVALIRGLDAGRFDFVLARLGPDTRVGSFMAYPGRHEIVSLLVRADHPLAGRRVSLSDTLPFEFVNQEAGSPIRTAVETAFLENGFPTPARVTNSSSLLVALSLVMGSDAIAPLTREVAQLLTGRNAGVAIVDTTETIAVPPFLVLRSRHGRLSPMAQRLLDEVLRRL
jgi:DNA-binding transcriptional LysR family regulator